MKKLVNWSGGLEDAVKFNWEPIQPFENRRCLRVFFLVVTILASVF